MPRRSSFSPLQAQQLAKAFRAEKVDYLFIGKSGAILLGYPSTTQDLDLFLPRSAENGERVIRGLRRLGFRLNDDLRAAIRRGKDFIQIKTGPFDVDLVHAPDGIPDYATAKARSIRHKQFPIASLNDIIASKEASGREKDLLDLELLKDFTHAFQRSRSRPPRTAAEKAARGTRQRRTRE